MKNTIFCKICGTQLSDDANFCHECGTKISKAHTISSSNNGKPTPSQRNVQLSKEKENGGCFKIFLKGICVLFILGMIGSCMSSNDNKNISDIPKSTQKVENKVDNEKPIEKKPEEVKQEKVVESPTPVPVQTQAAPQQQVVNDQRSFVANAKTGKIHVSTCRSVSRMKEANKVYITGSAAAKASGYSPCVNCRPF